MSIGSTGSGKGLSLETFLIDLEQAWKDRGSEAAALTSAGHVTMGLALRIYALEIRIKTLICERLNVASLPQHCKTHELPELMIFTGLWSELEAAGNAAIRKNWDLLVQFGKHQLNNLRYKPSANPAGGLGTFDPAVVTNALDDATTGVHAWLSKPR